VTLLRREDYSPVFSLTLSVCCAVVVYVVIGYRSEECGGCWTRLMTLPVVAEMVV